MIANLTKHVSACLINVNDMCINDTVFQLYNKKYVNLFFIFYIIFSECNECD